MNRRQFLQAAPLLPTVAKAAVAAASVPSSFYFGPQTSFVYLNAGGFLVPKDFADEIVTRFLDAEEKLFIEGSGRIKPRGILNS